MSVVLGWGGFTTHHVTCCSVCLWGWGGGVVTTYHVTCFPLCLWDRVGLGGWGGVTTQTMWHAVLYVCGVVWCGVVWSGVTTQTIWRVVLYVCGIGFGWRYNTDYVTCGPVYLRGWGIFKTTWKSHDYIKRTSSSSRLNLLSLVMDLPAEKVNIIFFNKNCEKST